MELFASAKRALWKPATITVLALVVAWNYAFSFEPVKEQFPFLVTMQLYFHQGLSRLIPSHPSQLVTVVEIDDKSYGSPPLSRRVPTNRSYLGALITNAADADAAAIALDFNLASTAPDPAPGQDPDELRAQDEDLFRAVQNAVTRKIPVILSTVLVSNNAGHWKRLPNIFDDSRLPLCEPQGPNKLPGCVVLGHINLPVDKRQIPLQMETFDWRNQPPLRPFDSLALATVTAFQTEMQTPQNVRDQPAIKESMPHDFVYGRFLPPSAFLEVSASDLYQNAEVAQARCRHHIVLIGANWNKITGEPVEDFRSPIGNMPGVYFHANYVESLLGGQYQKAVPVWFSLTFDFVIGIWLYLAYHAAKKPRDKLAVLGVFLFPLLAAYIIEADFNRYLDFVLPLALCFVHLGIEHYKHLKKGHKQIAEASPAL